jgi:hypothetical protein
MRCCRALAISFVVACCFAACSDDEAAGTGSSCSRDIDCAEGRVCEKGRCATPSGGSGGAGGTSGTDSGSGATGGSALEGGGGAVGNDAGKACTADNECPAGTLCIALVCRAPGACTSATDRSGVEAEYDVTDDAGTRRLRVRDIARECGIQCLISAPAGTTDAELAVCTHTCILDRTRQALSAGCADCLVETVNCGRQHCLTQCIDPTNLNCIPCICGENLQRVNCTARFETCGGVPSTTCAGLPDAT